MFNRFEQGHIDIPATRTLVARHCLLLMSSGQKHLLLMQNKSDCWLMATALLSPGQKRQAPVSMSELNILDCAGAPEKSEIFKVHATQRGSLSLAPTIVPPPNLFMGEIDFGAFPQKEQPLLRLGASWDQ